MLKIKKILFVFSGIIFTLILLELLLTLWGYAYLHLKNPAKDIKKKSGEFNILCLGDSFTLGIGAPKGQSYPDQLEKLLNKSHENNNFNVYKEFRINSSTVSKYLTADIERYKPDLIVVMIGCNDRWSLENCNYFKIKNCSYLTEFDIWLSDFKVYKLAKISLLNFTNLLKSKITKSDHLSAGSIYTPFSFKNQAAERYFRIAYDYDSSGNYESALKGYKNAEQLEPKNPSVHFALARIYLQVLHNFDLGKKHAILLLYYGNSSVVSSVFMLLNPVIDDKNKMIINMKDIIEARYKNDDKIKALRYLKILHIFQRDDKKIEKIIGYNLGEIIKIIKRNKIKIVLMQYPNPDHIFGREVVNSAAHLFKIPLVDNRVKFENKLRTTGLKKEDFFADGHCNAAGYRLIAQNVYDALISSGLISVEDEKGAK
ncbi:MAG: tetratricopeptide repeat protein [Candidatus Omnitrophica bacterium]|nr:tetratricopeptide repeat protein [Candidatus Omnitrophota bacterium]